MWLLLEALVIISICFNISFYFLVKGAKTIDLDPHFKSIAVLVGLNTTPPSMTQPFFNPTLLNHPQMLWMLLSEVSEMSKDM